MRRRLSRRRASAQRDAVRQRATTGNDGESVEVSVRMMGALGPTRWSRLSFGRTEAITVRAVLSRFLADHPAMRARMLDDGAALRRDLNIFVGEDNIRGLGGLDTPVAPGEEVWVIPPESGG